MQPVHQTQYSCGQKPFDSSQPLPWLNFSFGFSIMTVGQTANAFASPGRYRAQLLRDDVQEKTCAFIFFSLFNLRPDTQVILHTQDFKWRPLACLMNVIKFVLQACLGSK